VLGVLLLLLAVVLLLLAMLLLLWFVMLCWLVLGKGWGLHRVQKTHLSACSDHETSTSTAVQDGWTVLTFEVLLLLVSPHLLLSCLGQRQRRVEAEALKPALCCVWDGPLWAVIRVRGVNLQ
jgi:hypothetical protein